MVDNLTQSTHDFLLGLGLTPEEATLYQTLIDQGPLSTLELARATHIPRSTVYRLLESLKQHQLVEEVVDQHRTLSAPVSPDKLELILKDRQAKITRLATLFPQVHTYLEQQIHTRQNPTEVKFYRGISGVQQMSWHVLEAKHGIVGYSQSKFSDALGNTFAQDLFEEMYFNKIPMRELISTSYIESVGGRENLGQEVLPPFRKYFETRVILDEKLTIPHSMDIFNDQLSIYDWQGDDIFGVEIRNEKVATMQKQIFELLWDLATPETELSKNQ